MLDPKRLRRVTVLHEDDALLVVNKPPGLAVHEGAGTGNDLLSVLKNAGSPKLWLAHRLDKATSGVVVCCKSAELTKQVQGRWSEATKRYRALVKGRPQPQALQSTLLDHDGRGKDAHSVIKTVAPSVDPACSWVTLRLGTGRKHQLRLQLAEIGHPILMDDKHGDFRANKQLRRAQGEREGPKPKHLMLHAEHVSLPHPVTGQRLNVQAPLPEMFVALGASKLSLSGDEQPAS